MPFVTAIALLSLVGAAWASPAGNNRNTLGQTAYTVTAHATAPTPPGTAVNCGAYHLVTEVDSCNSIGMYFGLTDEEFRDLNPSINADCSNLISGYEYCIVKVTNITPRSSPAKTLSVLTPSSANPPLQTATSPYIPAPGPTKNGSSLCCRKWHTCVEGDTCQSINNDAGITYNEFRAWNPEVNRKSTNLWVGYSYCVDGDTDCSPSPTTTRRPTATPKPVQVGMVAGCTRFYQAQEGDYCGAIAWKFGIDVARFISWNPGVGDDCQAVLTGYYYCVAK